MKRWLECPCGDLLQAEDDDGIVEMALAHLRAKHPDMAEHYTREDILSMAQ